LVQNGFESIPKGEEKMDNIAVIDGQAAMAYQGETPWHQLGVEMTNANVITAMEAAKLDWKVNLEPIFLRKGKSLGKEIPDKFAVVRDLDREVLGVVGTEYKTLQNFEAFDVLTPACEQFGVTIETAGALGIGEHVWMLAKMKDSIEPIPGDKVNGYFLISTGHNGNIRYTAKLTPVRVVCQNTLSLAMSDGRNLIQLKHTESDLEQLGIVEHLITSMVKALTKTGETFKELAAKKFTATEVWEYIDAVFQYKQDPSTDIINSIFKIDVPVNKESAAEKRRNQVYELVYEGTGSKLAGSKKQGEPTTVWAAYNGVAEYIDHVRPAERKNSELANKSALFGTGADTKIRALNLAVAA
jgi:phage/plasmid-like protein (TIGR03299 family)